MAIFITEGTTAEDEELDNRISAITREMLSQADYMEQTVERMSKAMGVKKNV